MIKRKKLALVLSLCIMVALFGIAITFTWTDEEGRVIMTDRVEKLPGKYRALLRVDEDRYVTPEGVGYERDANGNYNFYDHSSPAKRVAKKRPTYNRPNALGAIPGEPVTQSQFVEIKRRYQMWGGEPVPEVERVTVRKIISPDTFELSNGQKVAYNGLEFPPELGPESDIYKEAVAYQEKIMAGKSVHMLYGPQRVDEKGRILAYVFIGTDLFVNAELIMNGYARVKIVPPNNDYEVLFNRLQDFAQKSMLGLWGTGEEEFKEMDEAVR